MLRKDSTAAHLVLAELGKTIGTVVVQAHTSRAQLYGHLVVVGSSLEITQLPVGIATIAVCNAVPRVKLQQPVEQEITGKSKSVLLAAIQVGL